MKIFSSEQIRQIDNQTIEMQNITSVGLMSRAAQACVDELISQYSNEATFLIFCGMGNNGGDGLNIARLLSVLECKIQVVVVKSREFFSSDAQYNYNMLPQILNDNVLEIITERDLEAIRIENYDVVIDALLGTGMNRPAEGIMQQVIHYINLYSKLTISIDVPSGLFVDQSTKEHLEDCVHSNLTLTFQTPKLAFLMAENAKVVPAFKILDIGQDKKSLLEMDSHYFYLERDEIRPLLLPRSKFSHKGTYGHALLYAGSKDKAGAALMTSEACLRSGAGLLTLHSVPSVIQALNIRLPEAMSSIDKYSDYLTEDTKVKYQAVGFGPGVGKEKETATVLKRIIQEIDGKFIIDADGLNILSENKTWFEFLPSTTILTPHLKEFERLFGTFDNDFERLDFARKQSKSRNIIIVLKGAHTAICLPNGNIFFNSNGNPSLAKGGSGDVLTGIILGLMTRGYTASIASILGVFVHGLAADLCTEEMSMESVLATDVIKKLPKAFKILEDL